MSNENPENKNIHDLAIEIHATAAAKGWWDKERNDAEAIALCHTEVLEACDAIDDDRQDDKIPEYKGWIAEQCDVLIRLLDWAVGKNILYDSDWHSITRIMCLDNWNQAKELNATLDVIGIPVHVSDLFEPSITDGHIDERFLVCSNPVLAHNILATITETMRKGTKVEIANVVRNAILVFAIPSSIIMPCMLAKMEYNKTRERMHGGKKF